MMKNFVLNIVCVVLIFCDVDGKATLNRIENCKADKNYAINYYVELNTENGLQYVKNATLKTAVDMNDDIEVRAEVFMFDQNAWKALFQSTGGLCELQDKFAGDFAIELEKASGIENGCPFPKGEYKLSNYKLDFTKFLYKDFPIGKLMIRVDYLKGKTEEELGCMEVEFEFEA